MPRLETLIGRDGPIIDVRIWIGPEHEEALKARGLHAPDPPKRRIISPVGVTVVSPGALVLIG
jgi:hypothetical protein